MKKVLLLGSKGFIGKNLSEYFENNRDDLVVDKPSIEELNLLDEKSVFNFLSENRYDIVINAAIFSPNRTECSSTNINELEADLRMFFNLERCSNLFGKMFYFGSGAEFDKTMPIVFAREDDVINGIPKNYYGIAKYTIGKIIEKSENIYNLRVFGLFGKYENWKSTFISNNCCKAIKNLPLSIRQNVYFDYMYINDFCKIIDWFIDNKPRYHSYNICTGKRIDLISIANIINKVSGKNLPIYVCKDGFANEYTGSNSRLLNELDNKFVFTDLEQSISKLYSYYERNEKDIDLMSLLY